MPFVSFILQKNATILIRNNKTLGLIHRFKTKKEKQMKFTILLILGAIFLTSCSSSQPKITKHENSYFYPNGKYDAVRAKQAYFDLMNAYKYPIPEAFKGDQLWAIDFGLGDFANVGMGGVFWANKNHKGGGYLGHEIFLLPGQMLVEHRHVACDSCPAKRESWLVRHGSVYSFSLQEKATGFPDGVKIPASQRKFSIVNSCKLVKAGKVDHLNKEASVHFIMAGPNGAIVTEFATFHDNKGLRFLNPNVKF
jgi:D-lyxose ketol-isomerase